MEKDYYTIIKNSGKKQSYSTNGLGFLIIIKNL